MESPDRKRQKVLKAKKTMPTSYQKQLEIDHWVHFFWGYVTPLRVSSFYSLSQIPEFHELDICDSFIFNIKRD